MENMEYIKALEQRIKALEEFINGIQVDNAQNITINECQIHGLGLGKCKDVSMDNVTIHNFGFFSHNASIENAIIHDFKNQKGKVKIFNSTINNKDE